MTDITTRPQTNSITDMLPFFVYGTLRPGSGNDRRWHGRAEAHGDGKVVVDGYRLVTCGFPYALPADGQRTVGCLIFPGASTYDAVRRDLDALEGVPGHYSRVAVDVQWGEETLVAWLYTPLRPESCADLPPVKGNDWRNEEAVQAFRRSR